MPNPQGSTFDDVINELTLSTLNNYLKGPVDNMSKNNALLYFLKKSKSIKKKKGGSAIRVNINYAENASFAYYSGYDALNLNPSNVLTYADYPWKQSSISVIYSGLEKRANDGAEAIYNLLKTRVANAIETFDGQIEKSMFSDGTGHGGKEIEGLRLHIADDPTLGTVGGINRATSGNEFWRNKSIEADAAGELNANPDKTNIQKLMNKMTNSLTLKGKPVTNVIFADLNMYSIYEESLQAIQRIADAKVGEAGFTSLMYKQIPVVNAGGIGGSCPANHMYFLDTSGMEFNYLGKQMLEEITDGSVRFQNQDAYGKIYAFTGNLVLSKARTQGTLWYTT